jgi:hypothetical protein
MNIKERNLYKGVMKLCTKIEPKFFFTLIIILSFVSLNYLVFEIVELNALILLYLG